MHLSFPDDILHFCHLEHLEPLPNPNAKNCSLETDMHFQPYRLAAMLLMAGVLFLSCGCRGISPRETISGTAEINALLHEDWQRENLAPIPQASDETFLRRARLDLTGRAPSLEEISQFCADDSPDKRERLIRRLLDTPEYGDLMAMRYADVFRVKSEFPINLWPNAVQLYHRYLREAALHDKPFRELAYEMLTASGSNFRVAPANFFRAVADRTPAGLAKATALTWLGIRLEKMQPGTIEKMAPFFSRIGRKSTAEWKEEIIYTEMSDGEFLAVAPDGTEYSINAAEEDPRKVFADWLIEDRALQCSKAWVNRAWHWLFGVPLSGKLPDDMPIPPEWGGQTAETTELNARVLTTLARNFHASGCKMKALLETICLSDAYLADWKTTPDQQQKAEEHLAVYPVHRIEAEILVDILADLTGHHEKYRSVIPEPFTILPEGTRAIEIPDGSISSATLDAFGRPPRDSGAASERNNAVTGAQRLYLMNSGILYKNLEQLARRKLLREHKKIAELADACFLLTLSRHATQEELKVLREYAESLPNKNRQQSLAVDLLWSLINGKEFLYHH